MFNRAIASLWVIGIVMTSFSAFAAEDAMRYDQVSFSVSAEREVDNDTVIAILYAAEIGQDTKELADKVNKAITWGLAEAQKVKEVKARTLAYTSYPNYNDKAVITDWQVRQSIELKSQNVQAMSQLLGVLQAQLKIETLNYEVSSSVKRELEDRLTTEAIAVFKRRATQLQGDMGRAEYRVVSLNINTIGQINVPPVYAMAMRSAESAPKVAPPSLDAGKQTLRVDIAAEIELSVEYRAIALK